KRIRFATCRALDSSAAPRSTPSRGTISATRSPTTKSASIISSRVKPSPLAGFIRRGPRRTARLEVAAVNVGVLPLAALDAVGAVRLDDVGVPVALEDVRLPPRVDGDLLEVAVGVPAPRRRAAGRRCDEGLQPLLGRREAAVVELVEGER